MQPTDRPKTAATSHDLIIAGASIAGLVAARAAATRGLKTIVIDPRREPAARVRTTGVLVKRDSETIDIPPALCHRIGGVRMYAPDMRHIDLHRDGYHFLATDTAALVDWLVDEAKTAGAELRFGMPFSSAGLDADCIRFEDSDVSGRYLLGADGGRSRIAELFGLGQNREFLQGLETDYTPYRGMDEDLLHCFVDSNTAPGYLGWVVPGAGMTQIGLAVSPTPNGTARIPDFNGFLSKIHPYFPGLLDIREKSRRMGQIPCGGLVHPISTRRVLLTGDAAGLVSPLTAGGIRLAFQFGRRTACAIADYLNGSGDDPGVLMAREYPSFIRKTLLRRAWSLAPSNALLNRALFTPPMRALATKIYFQQRMLIPAHLLPLVDTLPAGLKTRSGPAGAKSPNAA